MKMSTAKQQQLRKRLVEMSQRLSGDIEELMRENTDPPARRARGPEDGADGSMEQYERDMSLIINEQQLREQIAAALQRIDEGTYGTCEKCGQPIAEERLEALPFAMQCIVCASQQSSL